MDALKACTTNVQVLADIDTIPVRLYASHGPAISPIPHVIFALREKGVVCTGDDDRIWIFQLDEEAASESIPEGLVCDSTGTIAEPGQVASENGRSIFMTFYQALEGSVSFALLHAHGAFKLSAWMWLLPQMEQPGPSVLIHMRHRLSEDGKKLHVATNIQRSEASSLSQNGLREDCGAILAPGGVPATITHAGQTGSRPAKIPAELRNDQWKNSVRRSLLMEGIQLADDILWVSIVPFGATHGALWPASLCFLMPGNRALDQREMGYHKNWQSWFQNTALEPHGDPLLFAEEWSNGLVEREQTQAMLDAPVADSTAMGSAPGAQPLTGTAAFDVTSPPLMHRPDLQAFHGIYPTPPEGLATQTGPQTQIQSDNLSAPSADTGNQPALTPSDPSHESNTAVLEGVPVTEGDQTLRNHSIVSSVGAPGHEWNRGSSDDLFGDMEDLEYGREEVGDADFNFFDDPDDEPEKVGVATQLPRQTKTMTTSQDAHPPTKEEKQAPGTGEPLDRSGDDLPSNAEQRLQESAKAKNSNEHTPAFATASNERVVGDETANIPPEAQFPHALNPAGSLKSEDIKPLSPFGIREALLPPPIPASASQMRAKSEQERRRSSFGPLNFNPSGPFSFRSSSYDYSEYKPDDRSMSYNLGPTRVPLAEIRQSSASTSSASSSDDRDLDEGDHSDSDANSLSTPSDHMIISEIKAEKDVPFETRKRKRVRDTSAYCGPQTNPIQRCGPAELLDPPDAFNNAGDQRALLQILFGKSQVNNQHRDTAFAELSLSRPGAQVSPMDNAYSAVSEMEFPPDPAALTDVSRSTLMAVYPDLKHDDLVIISQIVAEQATTITGNIAQELDILACSSTDTISEEHLMLSELGETFKANTPSVAACDIPSLTLVRESLPVQRAQPTQPAPTLASQARHPPRPPPRIDPTTLGPDILPLPASYIRAQRGDAMWEMVPTALTFWEALGLGPVRGAKEIRHFCVAPDGDVLGRQLLGFLQNLKATYECCKFGSMALGTELIDKLDAPKIEVQTITPVGIDNSASMSMMEMAQAFWNGCTALGVQLASIAFDEPGRTFVVSMTNPFPLTNRKDWVWTNQCLAACFVRLSKAYHTTAARIAKRDGKVVSQTTMSDIDFKILPISLVASYTSFAVPTAQQMEFIAREYYDRCPPSSDALDDPSPMSNAAAPSVELVAPLPKRISFQLASEPPTDLLHEASVLHVAYAISADGEWVNVVWSDNTGRYTSSSAFCLQGRSFVEVALEAWERTIQLIKAREVIWRVFIATTGSNGVEASMANCWKEVIAQHTDRKQLLSVTLLHFQPKLSLQIIPPLDSAALTGQGTGSSAPTPATTPLPLNGPAASTASPDTVGAGNATGTAPPTPAPSEAATSILEADPDAHLIETEDETWGMLIDKHVASILCPTQALPNTFSMPNRENIEALSHGVIIKRGKSTASLDTIGRSEKPFPCAGASLIWTLRVRPKSDRQGGGAGGEKSNVDEGSARHAEVMLREVLGFFRNLALLSKIKGLDSRGLVPVHIATAAMGADGLNGLLGKRSQVKAEMG